jgi:hypothetical protein
MGVFITTPEHAKVYLEESARIMKQYCAPILQGDLALLEEITKERRALSGPS